jgi:hypothetical protein
MKKISSTTFPAFYVATCNDAYGDLYQFIVQGQDILFRKVDSHEDLIQYDRKDILAIGKVMRRFMHKNPDWWKSVLAFDRKPLTIAVKPSSVKYTHIMYCLGHMSDYDMGWRDRSTGKLKPVK